MGWFSKSKKEEPADAGMQLKAKERVEAHQKELGFVLKQKNLGVTTARVVLVMDVSGSMGGAFRSGMVQNTVERCLPVGLEFDDDGSIEVFIFSGRCREIRAANIDNIDGFVKKYVEPKADWNGTQYAPAVNMITQQYGIKNPSKDPTFVIFVTDGDNSDKSQATQAIVKAAEFNIFWKFVGIGYDQMTYLEHLDDMDGRVVDNANFFQVKDIDAMEDRELYEKFLEEYGEWTAKARMAGILK